MWFNKRARFVLYFVASCLGMIFISPVALLHAQDNQSAGLFNPLTYTTQNTGSNGLVNSKVFTIHEDKAGALWFGTGAKVARYKQGAWDVFLEDDGWDEYKGFWEKDPANVYFINYHGLLHYEKGQAKHLSASNTPGLLPYIHTSYTDAAGVIWLAGTNHEGKEYRIISNRGDGWKEIHRLDLQALGLEMNYLVYSMFIDSEGGIWLSTYHDLLYYNGSTWRKMYNRHSGGAKYGFALDKQNRLLLINEGGIYTYENGAFSVLLPQGGTSNLEADLEGNWWFGDQFGNLHKWDGQSLSTVHLPSPLTEDQTDETTTVCAIRQISDGSLYVGTTFGVWHITNLEDVLQGAQHFSTFDGLPSNNITSILQDTNGVYWYGTDAGLSTFDGQQWKFISQKYKPHLVTLNGDVWCSKGAVHNFYLGYNTLTVYDGDTWKDFSPYETGVTEVTSIAQSPDERIFVAGLGGTAVWDGVSWQKSFDAPSLKIYNLFADSKGGLWFSYQQEEPRDPYNYGVGYYKDQQVHYFGTGEVLDHMLINKIIEDQQGHIWFATYNDGVIRFDGENWHVYNMGTANLLDNFISVVVEDDAGGIWVVYPFYLGLGASRFDGTSWKNYTTKDGLPTNKIKDLYMAADTANEEENAGGRILASTATTKIWIGSQVGLSVLDFKLTKDGVDGVLAVDAPFLSDDLRFFPNPAIDRITLRFQSGARPRTIQLLDLQGRVKMEERIADRQEVELSLATLPKGVYLLRIGDASSTATYKVIKQ